VPNVTNISFDFEATPRPRCDAATPGAFAPWALTGVSLAALRHDPVQGTSVVSPAPVATQLVRKSTSRKQYVYMTRVNAGGDGASGPYPEREPV
jgi:hypothetical protein